MFKHVARGVSAVAVALSLGACGPAMSPEPEPTTFKVRLENVAPFAQLKSGSYHTRVGGSAPGALKPGEAFEVKLTAGKGQRLSFASMFGASNDWVFATAPGGIELYEDGVALSGDVTSKVFLYDVGTEVDEEPGVGPHTGPNQGSSTDGPGAVDPVGTVRRLSSSVTLGSGARFNLPPVASMVRATLSVDTARREFTFRLENVSSDTSTLMTSQGARPVRVSPGVWTLSTGGEPLFSEGKPDRGQGLEAIAESGNIAVLAPALEATTGVGTPISPGVFVVHASGEPLFTEGMADRGQGLERLAEEGNVAPLTASLKDSAVFNTPEGKTMAGAAAPGSAYAFEVKARPGDRLSFATMFGMSNDWVFATPPSGLALFDAAGMALEGDRTGELRLYDVGTELSEEPAVGPNTGPQQSGPNAGAADADARVREVGAAYGTAVTRHLKLTVSR